MMRSVTETVVYHVPGMHCAGCTRAVESELRDVAGVEDAAAELERKTVTVRGTNLDDGSLRAAIEEAGYQAEA
jgi:copper chaperone CopZ